MRTPISYKNTQIGLIPINSTTCYSTFIFSYYNLSVRFFPVLLSLPLFLSQLKNTLKILVSASSKFARLCTSITRFAFFHFLLTFFFCHYLIFSFHFLLLLPSQRSFYCCYLIFSFHFLLLLSQRFFL